MGAVSGLRFEGADDGVRQQLPEGVHLGREQRGQGDVHGEGEARGRRERVHGHVAEVEQGRPEELAEGPAVLVHLGGEPVQLRRHAGLGQVQLLEGRQARLEEVPRAVQVARLEAELPEVRPQEQAGAAGGGGGQTGLERPALPLACSSAVVLPLWRRLCSSLRWVRPLPDRCAR